MFSIKEMVRSVENELILLNLFEWRAVSVLFFQTFNPKFYLDFSDRHVKENMFSLTLLKKSPSFHS